MPKVSHETLRDVGRRIYAACGAPAEEAALVTDVLVDANLMGLDSHGISQTSFYVADYHLGKIVPGAMIETEKDSETAAVLNGNKNFGIVAATRATELAVEKAKQHHVACVTAHNGHHVARLGAYIEAAARNDNVICLAAASWPINGHYVAPWGGREGRLATNPFACAIPTDGGDPMLLDMSTSAISESKIRLARHKEQTLPENLVLDANGAMTCDPHEFYGSAAGRVGPQQPVGSILTFGGAQAFKGFGLSVLVEVLTGTLCGHTITDRSLYGNRYCCIAIDANYFVGEGGYGDAIRTLMSYLTDTPPAEGFDGVILPGEYQFRRKAARIKDGIWLDDESWDQIVEAARSVGVELGNV
jgi:LDH2 family malate/lactate/ureidoglycolate dehydrogenase